MRLFCAMLLQACLFVHLGYYMPQFDKFTPFPQQPVLIIDIILELILEGIVIYSYCKKTLKFVKLIMFMLLIIFQISICLAPDENATNNLLACQSIFIGIFTSVIMVMSQSLIMVSRSNLNFAVIFTVSNIMLQNMIIIFNYRKGGESLFDILWYAIIEGA